MKITNIASSGRGVISTPTLAPIVGYTHRCVATHYWFRFSSTNVSRNELSILSPAHDRVSDSSSKFQHQQHCCSIQQCFQHTHIRACAHTLYAVPVISISHSDVFVWLLCRRANRIRECRTTLSKNATTVPSMAGYWMDRQLDSVLGCSDFYFLALIPSPFRTASHSPRCRAG